MDNKSIDRFYKKSIVDRDKNLFLRVEALEEMLRSIKTGRPVSVTNIQNIINENQEIILPSVVGGTSDPTDPAFTGIVISPSGQTIDGVLYHFALVENGVVVTGWGDDGGEVVVGGGDVSLDTDSIFDQPNPRIAFFMNNNDRKITHLPEVRLNDLFMPGTPLFLDDTASGIGVNKVMSRTFDANAGTLSIVTVTPFATAYTPFISPQIGLPILTDGEVYGEVWLSADVTQDYDVELRLRHVTDGGSDINLLGQAFLDYDFETEVEITATPQKFILKMPIGDMMTPSSVDVTDRIQAYILVRAHTSSANVTLHYGEASKPSFIIVPKLIEAGTGFTQAQVMARMS